MSRLEGQQTLMRIFVGEGDRWHGKVLYEALVERLREAGCAGATVLKGAMGFGASSVIHTDRILRLSEDLPVVIEVVDTPERVETLIPLLDEMISGGMVTLEKAHVIRYRAEQTQA